MGDGPQHHTFPHGHGKIIDNLTGEFVTFMAAADSFFPSTIPDFTLGTMHEQILGQAPLAMNIRGGQIFTVGKGPLAGDPSLVKPHQAVFEFFIVITTSDVNGTDAAVQPAR
jgi:hypothetical protein